MIGKILGIGKSDFSSVINTNNVYFDKTLLIKDILESNTDVTLFTRPRRFGKTLNLSMIEHFFDITKKEQNAKLFTNLNIMNTEYKYRLGSNPVINITFKGVKFDDIEQGKEKAITTIQDLYEKHDYVFNSLSDREKRMFNKVLSEDIKLNDLADSLLNLCKYLHKHHNKKVILLIDEYDTPLISAYANNIYKEVSSIFSSLYSNALKDNPYLEFAVLTGILRIAKENIFSGLNNIRVNTILSNDFSTYFGFTHDEVKYALDCFGLKDKYEDVCSWYDGYNFGGHKIFNPWSILNYLNDKQLIPYWINTSSNDLLMYHFRKLTKDNFDKVNCLLKNEEIKVELLDNTILEDVYDDENIWALLLYSGYLTISKKLDIRTYTVKLVNYEIANTIEETFLKSTYLIKTYLELNGMFDMLLNDKLNDFEDKLNKITKTEETFNDFRLEKDYRLYFSTLLIFLKDRLIKFNEIESGTGRTDLIFYTKDLSKGYLFEFKKVDNQKDIEEKHKEAKEQIDNKQYKTIFEKLGIKNINVYTVVCNNKNMYFKKWRL